MGIQIIVASEYPRKNRAPIFSGLKNLYYFRNILLYM